MRGEILDKPTVGELLAAEARKRAAPGDVPSRQPEQRPDLPPGALPSPA